MVLYFIFGFCNAGHMLNFTAAGDNVPQHLIGTSASIVNGSMFVAGGLLMGLRANCSPARRKPWPTTSTPCC